MVRRWNLSLAALLLTIVVLAGCSSSTSTSSADSLGTTASVPNDPAARAAFEFLDAVVKGDTARASELLTPLAIERIAASGKPFQLPGLSNYTFRVGQVRRPAEDKAFVQCMGTDRSADGKTIEEEFCWLLTRIDEQWRVAGISYSAGPQQTLMIYSFENPERGAIPVQQLMAQTGNGETAAMNGQVMQNPMVNSPSSSESPRTAQDANPTAIYR